MIAFQELLPEGNVEHIDIVLKYRYNLPNGSVVWAGLTTMLDSTTFWTKMLRKTGKEDPILGVFLKQDREVRLEGMPVAIYFHSAINPMLSKTERLPVPQNYEVISMHTFKISSCFTLYVSRNLDAWYTLSSRKTSQGFPATFRFSRSGLRLRVAMWDFAQQTTLRKWRYTPMTLLIPSKVRGK